MKLTVLAPYADRFIAAGLVAATHFTLGMAFTVRGSRAVLRQFLPEGFIWFPLSLFVDVHRWKRAMHFFPGLGFWWVPPLAITSLFWGSIALWVWCIGVSKAEGDRELLAFLGVYISVYLGLWFIGLGGILFLLWFVPVFLAPLAAVGYVVIAWLTTPGRFTWYGIAFFSSVLASISCFHHMIVASCFE